MSACPACHGPSRATSVRLTTTRPFLIERCSRCTLAFATPRPTEDELSAFYTGAYFDGSNQIGGYGDYEGGSWAEPNARRMWELLKNWEPSLADVQPRSVLDLGCATGEFASSLQQQGWTAAGVELAASARDKSNAKGVVTATHLSEVQGSFGLITMFHVLEHVLEPVTTLREARDHAAPSGRLLVEVPQWDSIGRYLKGKRWSALTPPEHINFFTRRSMADALSASGWKLERAGTVHTQGTDRAVEALWQGRYGRAFGYATTTAALQASGRAGYLRALARVG